MHQMRDSPQPLGGSVGSIPSTFVSAGRSASGGDLATLQKTLRGHGVHSTPASNLKLSESVRNAHHDGSPSIVSTRKMHASRSYSSDLKSHVDGVGGGSGSGSGGGGSSAGGITSSSSNNNLAGGGGGSGAGGGGGATSNCSSTSTSTTNLSMPDISPSNSQFFEVMYVGKIKVSHKRVPFTFIDDALPKFKAYDTQRMKMQAQLTRRVSQTTAPVASDINNLESLEKITMARRRYSTSDGITQPLSKFSMDEQRQNSLSITEEGESNEEVDGIHVTPPDELEHEKNGTDTVAANDGDGAEAQTKKSVSRQQSEVAGHHLE